MKAHPNPRIITRWKPDSPRTPKARISAVRAVVSIALGLAIAFAIWRHKHGSWTPQAQPMPRVHLREVE